MIIYIYTMLYSLLLVFIIIIIIVAIITYIYIYSVIYIYTALYTRDILCGYTHVLHAFWVGFTSSSKTLRCALGLDPFKWC